MHLEKFFEQKLLNKCQIKNAKPRQIFQPLANQLEIERLTSQVRFDRSAALYSVVHFVMRDY